VELDDVRLRLRDWPGLAGPLVHIPDPIDSSELIQRIANTLAPHFRVVSLSPRGDSLYMVDAADLRDTLRQFGFSTPMLIGEKLGCLTSLLVAAWYPTSVRGLVLIDASYDPPSLDTVGAKVLFDCPPDLARLRSAVRCQVKELKGVSETLVADVEAFAKATLP
jgi:pimeloyl-ACP methyl ester carboxylesterase